MGTCTVNSCTCQCTSKLISCQCGSNNSQQSEIASQVDFNVNNKTVVKQNKSSSIDSKNKRNSSNNSSQSLSRQNRFSIQENRKSPGTSKDSTETHKQSKLERTQTKQSKKSLTSLQMKTQTQYLESYECNIVTESEGSSSNIFMRGRQINIMNMNKLNNYFNSSENNSNESQGINFDTFALHKNSDEQSESLKKQQSPKFQNNSKGLPVVQKQDSKNELKIQSLGNESQFKSDSHQFSSLSDQNKMKPPKAQHDSSLEKSRTSPRNSQQQMLSRQIDSSQYSLQVPNRDSSDDNKSLKKLEKSNSYNQGERQASSQSQTPSKGVLKQRSHNNDSFRSQQDKKVKFNLPQSHYIKEKIKSQQRFYN